MKEQILSEALGYLNRGFSIIPVHLSKDEKGKYQKKPLVKWQDYQQSKATEIDLRRWMSSPTCNGLGIVTGKVSGVVILDIDDPELINNYEIPITPKAKSISGGYHYYFKYPTDIQVSNHQALLPKIDIRADGGFIVAPPSGTDLEHSYQWELGLDTPLADIPNWLRDILEITQSSGPSGGSFDPDKIVEPGERHKASLQAIGYFSRKHHGEGIEKVWDRLTNWMDSKFTNPFNREDKFWLKTSFDRYAPKNIATSTGSSKSSSQIIKLVISGKFNLFKTPKDKKTFIGHPEQPLIVIPTDSEDFYDAVSLEYYSQYGTPLTKDVLKKVLPTVRALIGEKGEEIKLFNRVAYKDGIIYYDLFEDHNFIRISSQGVQVVGSDVIKSVGIRFVRYAHQQKQQMPVLEASVDDAYRLFEFLAIKDKEHQQLLLSHLATTLVPSISRCMLVLQGSRGSAKSTTLKLIRSLIDPSSPSLLRIPRNDDDLQIYLDKNYFCCFDNVSFISKEVSDSLCMMITGGGTIKRKLFTDGDIVTTDLKSCLALNGINLAIHEPDLLERSLIIETNRVEIVRSEEELFKEFEVAKPHILGGLFTLLSLTLRYLTDQSPGIFRMADYYRYASSAAASLGVTNEQFGQIFQRNVDRQNEASIESSPLAQVIVDFMADKEIIETKSSDLYAQLIEKSKEMGFDKGIPRGVNNLWKKLNPLRIDLEGVGIFIDRRPRSDGTYIQIENKSRQVEVMEVMEALNPSN